jgi:hypothetical protein
VAPAATNKDSNPNNNDLFIDVSFFGGDVCRYGTHGECAQLAMAAGEKARRRS